MNKLEKYNKILEAAMEKNKGLETYINLSQLVSLTEPLEENFVMDNNETLTQKHQLVLSAYGFDNMLDLYNYALANTSQEEYTTKGKNYDVLDRVKRTVTRDGKQMNTTVYSEIKDTDNKIKSGGKVKKPRIENNKEHGLQLIPVVLDGTASQVSTKDLQEITALARELTVVLGDLQDVNYIELLVDAEGSPRACLGFIFNQDVELTYLATDETVDNLTLTALHKLIELALETEKGIAVKVIEKDAHIQLLLLEQYGVQFDEESQTYHATYEELVNAFGEDYIKVKGNN